MPPDPEIIRCNGCKGEHPIEADGADGCCSHCGSCDIFSPGDEDPEWQSEQDYMADQ